MKSIINLVVLVTTILSLGFIAQAQDGQWPSVTVSSLVANKYLGFGTGNLLSKDPVIQSDLNISFKNGLYIDLWNSRSLKGSWDNGSLGNEVDYQIGWKVNLATNLNFNIGTAYCDEPNALSFGGGDILYTHAFLTKDLKYLSVSVGYENFVTMPDSGFRGGNLISLGVSKYQLICKDKIGIRASMAGVYDTGTLGSGKGFILRGNAGIDWNITKRLTFNVAGVNWYAPLTPHDKRIIDAVVYSGFSFKFD